jgi:hypothetical protein
MDMFSNLSIWGQFLLVIIACGIIVCIIVIISELMKGSTSSSGRGRKSQKDTHSAKFPQVEIKQKLRQIENLLGIPPTATIEEDNLFIKRLNEIYEKVNILTNPGNTHGNNPIKTSPQQPAEPLPVEPEPGEQDIPEIVEDVPPEPPEKFIPLYNRAVTDRAARDKFSKQFQFLQLGNKNSLEQHLGHASEPEFRETTNGDFLAATNDERIYYVVPQFDITITPQSFVSGGINYAFECPNHDPNLSYSDIKVKRPAQFERRDDQWILKKQGELIL